MDSQRGFLAWQKPQRLSGLLDLERRLIDHRQFGRLFASHRCFIAHHRHFHFCRIHGDDVTTGFGGGKNKFRRRLRFLRCNLCELVGVAIAINERCNLFFDAFCSDMKEIGANSHAIDLLILGIERIDLDLHACGLGGLLFGLNAETRFCWKKGRGFAAAQGLATD